MYARTCAYKVCIKIKIDGYINIKVILLLLLFVCSKFIVHCSLFTFVTLFALRLDGYIGNA